MFYVANFSWRLHRYVRKNIDDLKEIEQIVKKKEESASICMSRAIGQRKRHDTT